MVSAYPRDGRGAAPAAGHGGVHFVMQLVKNIGHVEGLAENN